MKIQLSKDDTMPLYAQIVLQVKRQIANGRLQADVKLPSIRTLAKQLEVSVITTKRAYEELEKEGLIYSVHGLGSFIQAQSKNATTEWKRLEFERQLESLIAEGKLLGLANEEILMMVQVYLDEPEINGGEDK